MCGRTDGAGCAETPWPLLVTNTAPPWRPLCLMYLSKIFRSPAGISITLVLLLQRTVACPAFTASTVIYCPFHSISLLFLCFVICSSLTSCAAAPPLLGSAFTLICFRPAPLSPRIGGGGMRRLFFRKILSFCGKTPLPKRIFVPARGHGKLLRPPKDRQGAPVFSCKTKSKGSERKSGPLRLHIPPGGQARKQALSLCTLAYFDLARIFVSRGGVSARGATSACRRVGGRRVDCRAASAAIFIRRAAYRPAGG